eukprot:5445965-Pleurochrysis_carterae.AAC.1
MRRVQEACHVLLHVPAEPDTVGILPLHKEEYHKEGSVDTMYVPVPRRAPGGHRQAHALPPCAFPPWQAHCTFRRRRCR